jgi:hypothetical protein
MLLEGRRDWTSDRTRGTDPVEYYDFFRNGNENYHLGQNFCK